MKDGLLQRQAGKAVRGVDGRRFLRAQERGEAILQELAARTGRSQTDICAGRKRGDLIRSEAMMRLQRDAGWSLVEIGKRMGNVSAESVAQRIHRMSYVRL